MIVNPIIWFAERQLNYVPHHFIKCPTQLTLKSKQWVQNNISGRYAFADGIDTSDLLRTTQNVYFEDQKDVTLYELIWAGSSE